MFSWKKAAIGSCLAFVLSCQTSPFNRKVAQEEVQQNQEVKYFDRLQDYTPYNYEVLFSDPECGVYTYTQDVFSVGGKKLTQKPENVYCKNKYDLKRSGDRPQSPQYRLVEWINQPNVKEIFFTYLSFRNKAVSKALCEVAKKGVKIHFVMSSTEDQTVANELVACSPENVQMKLRGMEGDLGYAHNKFFIINPHSNNEFKMVFSSGNMTSGPVIHHENWNFITTNANSQFAQSHVCAMNAEWDEVTGRSATAYINAIRTCRDAIKAPVEKDIKVFFVPGEGEPTGNGKKTAVDYMLNGDVEAGTPGINNAKRIWMACHRFFYSKMVNGLSKRMSNAKFSPDMRIVADDDTYYKAMDPSFQEGDTMPEEYFKMQKLEQQGAQVKFMETNSAEHQLHHSKYLIFADKNSKGDTPSDFKAVFTGSANLTGAGFNKNWENSYYVTIPAVVQRFAEHYVHTWNDLATKTEDLPKTGSVNDLLIDQPIIKNQTENK
ncbi:hypothetical protein CIK05_12925 [Bdellovibrio sp. qaytius]|nr:hypothetical protein CIK05_12925 [Bdellovibrio sp. qaytius]